jgi:hypothetical protein
VLEPFDTLFNKRNCVAVERYWSPSYSRHGVDIAPERDDSSTLKYEPSLPPTAITSSSGTLFSLPPAAKSARLAALGERESTSVCMWSPSGRQDARQRSTAENRTRLNFVMGAVSRLPLESKIAPWSDDKMKSPTSLHLKSFGSSPAFTAAFRQAVSES